MSNPVLPAEVRDHRERDWFWANNDIIDRYGFAIGADGIAVYMALARYADRNGQCWPSYARMAERLALSRPTVIKCLNRLVFAGLATSVPRTKPTKAGTEQPDSNLYTLLTVRALSDEERIALKEAIKAREGGKGGLLGTAVNEPSKGGLPPLPSKGDLPPLVKEVDHPSKAPLPDLVKDVVRNKTQLNKTHGTNDGDGDGRTLAFLIDQGFGSAKEFAHLPFEQMKQDYENRRADKQNTAIIVNAWRRNPPTKDYHYERPIERPAAPDNPRRSAARAAIHSQRGSGGSDLRDPGWRERLIAKAEAGELS